MIVSVTRDVGQHMQFSGEERRWICAVHGGSQYLAQGRLLYAVVVEQADIIKTRSTLVVRFVERVCDQSDWVELSIRSPSWRRSSVSEFKASRQSETALSFLYGSIVKDAPIRASEVLYANRKESSSNESGLSSGAEIWLNAFHGL